MLSPRDLGVAVAVTVLLSTAELISDFGLDRYLISRSSAKDAPALAVAHCLQLIRGLALALIIWMAAPLIAGLFGEPGLGVEFRWCALILLIETRRISRSGKSSAISAIRRKRRQSWSPAPPLCWRCTRRHENLAMPGR
jgi:hypothetical protein